MRIRKLTIVLVTMALLSALAPVLAGRFTVSASPDTGSPWTRYQLSGGTINDIDAISATDAWAGGNDGILAHWDGSSWQAVDASKTIEANQVSTLDMLASNSVWAYAGGLFILYDGSAWTTVPDSVSSTMYSISMLSSTDGWTSGTDAHFGHWDGSNWSEITASPSVTETMYSISMLSSTDGWAVGGTVIPNVGMQGKIARWNGTSWDAFPSPVTNRIFYGVDFSSPTEGWVVGVGGTTEHWNGTNWTLVPPPGSCQLSCGAVNLSAIYSINANDAWAVGSTNGWTSNTWHWDGLVWTEINAPTGAPLHSVVMLAPNNGWSVADRGTIYHWDGTSWSVATTQWLTNGLYALDFVSPDDGWAVGVLNQSTPPAWGLQHWNGSAWTEYQPPSYTPGPMKDVDMLASDQVWAVGSQAVFYWHGSTWTQQSATGNFMDALSMVSPTDGWAVGSSGKIVHFDGTSWTNYTSPTTTNLWSLDMVNADEGWAGGTLGLMLHYQSGTWSQVAPNPGTTTIEAIQMLDANEGWAVGYNGEILHYTGGTWSPVSSPVTTNLLGIDMLDANEGWAVGASAAGGTSAILHYSGGTWSVVDSPTRNNLRDVYVFPDGRGWAVGESPGVKLYMGDVFGGGTPTPTPTGAPATNTPTSTLTATNTPTPTTIATNTNTPTGTSAPPTSTNTPSPSSTAPPATATATATGNTPTSTATTMAASATPTNEATATATAVSTSEATPSSTSSATPTAQNTSTPGATNTAAPTNTPGEVTATPTACTLEFTDVLPGSTFYDNIKCLACRGIINGYSSGCDTGNPCFKPANLVTRGQLAKIASNAAGFNDPTGPQQYEDVPLGSTFFEYIWQLTIRGYVNGYPCGGAGEPCGAGNLPYFRPNANITRGQISKIISNAAGLTAPAGSQQFQDVLPGSTFYEYIWRLTALGVMNGYACGGVGEPCVGPANLPYFRPGSNATRGQASKIVANTFLPGCQTPYSP